VNPYADFWSKKINNFSESKNNDNSNFTGKTLGPTFHYFQIRDNGFQAAINNSIELTFCDNFLNGKWRARRMGVHRAIHCKLLAPV
jgi:hypothetical protein